MLVMNALFVLVLCKTGYLGSVLTSAFLKMFISIDYSNLLLCLVQSGFVMERYPGFVLLEPVSRYGLVVYSLAETQDSTGMLHFCVISLSLIITKNCLQMLYLPRNLESSNPGFLQDWLSTGTGF